MPSQATAYCPNDPDAIAFCKSSIQPPDFENMADASDEDDGHALSRDYDGPTSPVPDLVEPPRRLPLRRNARH